jgi:AcrR family transcriptional regulator
LVDAAKKATTVELTPRATPTQKRAKELVENILTTTGRLLDEVGVDGLTTNLIAERAGIRIASLYRYYPNKFAVMVAMWQRTLTRELATLSEFMATSGGRLPLEEVVAELVDAAVKIERTSPGMLTLLRAMRVTPELQAVEAASSELVASNIALWLGQRGAAIPPDRMPVVARMTTEIAWAALDYASGLDPEVEEKVLDELKLVARSYFANYFPDA